MSLKNETRSALEDTKTFYREYISGMNRERFGKEFYKDTDRLKQLYEEAVREDTKKEYKRLPGNTKLLRLFSELTERLNPMRVLIFGLSILVFLGHYLFIFLGISQYFIFYELLIPFAFASILMLLLI